MKPLKSRLLQCRERVGMPWAVLERDYLLSWILAGLSQVDKLNNILVFKGGTALKKCYFGEYRFSEDLDFTIIDATVSDDMIEKGMQEACQQAVRLLDSYAPVSLVCNRYVERNPHPRGQLAFDIHAQFPWHRQHQVNVMVEMTRDEILQRPAEMREVIHEYGEVITSKIPVYALEEIVAEKLRAILQTLEIFERRGWVRSRARDYYDLWRILGTYRTAINGFDFSTFLQEKCKVKEVTFTGAEDFFSKKLLQEVERTWEQWLGTLVPELPSYQEVISELRNQVLYLLEG